MSAVKGIQNIALVGGIVGAAYLSTKCFFTVQPGHVAIKFNRISGLKNDLFREGFRFRIPFFEIPITYNVQTKPTTIRSQTANRDMQNVNVGLRVLYRPKVERLPDLYRYCGLNYDERVLPSIVNEVLKSVIAQYSASQLMSQRDQISSKIRSQLENRAQSFYIVIDDVSIVDLSFSNEYTQAIEAKQVAQQDAEKAKYIVEQALQHKKSMIIKAQADAKSIELIGKQAQNDPSYIELKKIQLAKEISQILSESRNHMLLDGSLLNLNVGGLKK